MCGRRHRCVWASLVYLDKDERLFHDMTNVSLRGQRVIHFSQLFGQCSYVHYGKVGSKWGPSIHICVALTRGSPGVSGADNVEECLYILS